MGKIAKGHLQKLEGFCKGPYMCGGAPQSGDFMLFEMLDQHLTLPGAADILDEFPKLKALHAAMRADPALAKYFDSELYAAYAQNNGLYTFHTGHGADFVYPPTSTVNITF